MRELRAIFDAEPGVWHPVPDLARRLYKPKYKAQINWDDECRCVREALDRLTPVLNLKRERIGRPGHRGSCFAYKRIKPMS
jgi:hypothetical protein